MEYECLLDRIKLRINSKEHRMVMVGQIDGIVDNDDDRKEKDVKSVVKKKEFFVHSGNNYNYSSVSINDDFQKTVSHESHYRRESMDKITMRMISRNRMVKINDHTNVK